MKHTNILAIITARGGSKVIPGKNIKKINGKPLMVWSIEAAKKSKAVSKIVVSSDDEAILKVAKHYETEALRRPAALATDVASSQSVVAHVLKTLRKTEKYVPDYIVLLQPTSPLRTAKDIDQAVAILEKCKADLCISVCEVDKKFLKMYVLEQKKYLVGAVNKNYPYMPRQKLPSAYLPNGAVYVMTTKAFLKSKNFIAKKVIPYVMEYERSVDIDNMADFKKAEKFLKKIK
jgi:CMP-N-acetylneuraminic acid synthetase